MFILRHIQLIVVLTDKDEKCWEKFHEPNVFSGESFVRPGGIPKNPRFCPNSRKKRGLPAGSKLACMAVIVVDKFDARGGERVIQGAHGDGCWEAANREYISESAKFCFNEETVTIYCGTCARGARLR